MKTVRTFTDQNEARMSVGLLEAYGIQANLLGAKEYASVVTGASEGRYQVLVAPDDHARADEILTAVEQAHRANLNLVEPEADGPPSVESTLPARSYFKKALILAGLLLMMLPLILWTLRWMQEHFRH